MWICLVPDIPHDLVHRGVEDLVEGNGKLYRTEIGGIMSADQVDSAYYLLPHFLGEQFKLFKPESAHVGRLIYGVEESCHREGFPREFVRKYTN
jgi:hypothetical protein